MPAGELRRRVAFDRRIGVEDGYGNVKGDWTEQFQRWARVRQRLGGEQVMAARLDGKMPVELRVRYDKAATAAITPAWRARNLATAAVYNILSVVDPDDKRAWLVILCEEGPPA